jgi:hypothetical protein
MITVATRAESEQAIPIACLAGQRSLTRAAQELIQRLPLRAENMIDLLRLGTTCLSIAAEQAFGERDARQAVLLWSQCEAGEKQIRSAIYHALRNGFIKNRDYDELFRIAADARKARQRELNRLRRELRLLALI